MYAFDLEKPTTVAAAVKALGREDAQALGGGQTLIPSLKQRLASPSVLVSLNGIKEMIGVRKDGDALVIGGATPHARGRERGGGQLPGAGASGGAYRRSRGQEPWHDRRQPRQQRPLGLLPGRRARLGCHGGDEQPQDRGGRLLRRALHHRARIRRDHHRGALSDPGKGELPEVRPTRVPLRAGRRLRREIRRTASASP